MRAIRITKITDPPFTASLSIKNDQLEKDNNCDMKDVIRYMKDLWKINRDDKGLDGFLKMIGIDLANINASLTDYKVSIDSFKNWDTTKKDQDLLEDLDSLIPNIDRRAKIIVHVNRAKYWDFHLK